MKDVAKKVDEGQEDEFSKFGDGQQPKEMKKRERRDGHSRISLHNQPQVYDLSSACSLCLFLRVLYFVSKHLRDTQ